MSLELTTVPVTSEQLVVIAKILDDLNRAESTKMLTPLGDMIPTLAAEIPIEADGIVIGYAVDDVGGSYAFQGKVL